MLPDLVAGRKRRRVGRFERMQAPRRGALLQEPPDAHDRAARAHAGDERVGRQSAEAQLPPDLRSRRARVRLDVVLVGELPGEEGSIRRRRESLPPGGCCRGIRPPLSAHERDACAEAADQVDPLLAHPVGHEDAAPGVPERAPDRGEGDAGVAARRLDDRIPRPKGAALVAHAQDVERHPVLDAPGHVEILGLGVDDAGSAVELEVDGQQGRVPDQAGQALESGVESFVDVWNQGRSVHGSGRQVGTSRGPRMGYHRRDVPAGWILACGSSRSHPFASQAEGENGSRSHSVDPSRSAPKWAFARGSNRSHRGLFPA